MIVTGAGSGIGRATALAFAQAGSRVVAVDIAGDEADKTAAACAESGAGGSAFVCDVSDAGAVTDLAEKVRAEHGPVDVLVNNAGVGMSGRFADTAIDDWRWIRSVNLDGVLHGCYAFGPAMLERGRGHVINMSSGLGYFTRATEPLYATTKAAVLAFSRSLHADWRPKGVGVTAICPGIINTPIIDSTRFLGDRALEENRTRAKAAFSRGHRPAVVAKVIVDAVRKDKVVATAGWEATLGWFLHRLLPLRAQDRLARIDAV